LKRVFLVIVIGLLGLSLFSTFTSRSASALEPVEMEWDRTCGGTGDDLAYSMVQTNDGGYAIAGSTYSYGLGIPTYSNFWLVKIDSGGKVAWNGTYGGNFTDYAYSVVQTGDGGYAIAGSTNSYGLDIPAHSNFWFVKTDSSGKISWSTTYGGTGDEYAFSVVQTSDGGYALAGYTTASGNSDFWLVKIDSGGKVEWDRTYGGTFTDCAYSMIQTSDGGYALAGYTTASGNSDFWLVKADKYGTQMWNKTYGGTGADTAYSLVQTSDEGYAIVGTFGATSLDFWLVKTDSNGNMQWNKTYGGTGGDYAYSVVRTSDGGYAIAGSTDSLGAGSSDFWLVKADKYGTQLWNKTYGGTGFDVAKSVVQTGDGGYAIAGPTYSYGSGGFDFWLIKLAATKDSTPPTTNNDYDGLWHTQDLKITLTATDDLSGVSETYYRPNPSALAKKVSVNGQPVITTESDNNQLQYWSVDNAGNIESPQLLTGIKVDKTEPYGSIVINNYDDYTTSTSVTLTLTATDGTSGIAETSLSNDGEFDTEPWETYSGKKTWILTSGDETKTVYARFKDYAGLISPTYFDIITLDTTPPQGSILIKDDATETTSTSVTLTLSSDDTNGVAQMRFSNDESTWSPWEPYNTTASWTLTPDYGTKEVYTQFMDNAGLTSKPNSDTIVLTAPPVETGNLVIYVEDSETNPISGATVESSSQPSGQIELTGITNADGYVTFNGVKPGPYTIQAYKASDVLASKSMQVNGGQTTTATLILLIEGKGSLIALAEDSEGNPLEGASVYLNGTYIEDTNPDGRLEIYNLTEGTYTVRVAKEGYLDNEAEVTVAADTEVTTSLILATYTAEDNTPPSISTPNWIPETPSEGKDVVIRTSVVDDATGVENVTLWYRVAEGEWEGILMELDQEGNWTATIPAQPARTIIEFYIESFDTSGNYAATDTLDYKVSESPSGINLYVIGAAVAGIAAASGAIVTVLKTNAVTRLTRMIKARKLTSSQRAELGEQENEMRRRQKERREKPKLIWTFTPPRKIRSGGHAYIQGEVKNDGKATATGVKMTIKGPPELKLDAPFIIGDISPNTTRSLRAKIECREKVPEGDQSLVFTLMCNETPSQSSVRAISFEPLKVGLLADSHNLAYLQKQGIIPVSTTRLQAWLQENKFDYEVFTEAENPEILRKYNIMITPSQYALSNNGLTNLRNYVQNGRGLIVLDGTGTIDADAFLRGDASFEGEKRVHDFYGYGGPNVASIEGGLRGIRIVETAHPITSGFKMGEILTLPTQKGVVFTQPVLKAKMLADQRVSIKGRTGYLGVSGLSTRQIGRGRIVHFNFDAESVIGAVSPLLEKAILWAADFE